MSSWTRAPAALLATATLAAGAAAQIPAFAVERTGGWLFGTSGAAVSFDPEDVTLRTPAADSVHGWQFTANRAITITHLGVYDVDDDGFLDDEHPVALWRESDQELLAGGTLSMGVGDILVDHFRYVDVEDVTLEPERDYVVGYYTTGPLFRRVFDDMASDIVALEVSSTIDIVQSRFVWPAGDAITFPNSTASNDRFGPNFMFALGDGECDPCDMNCDKMINAFDIEPFLALLFDPQTDPCCGARGDIGSTGDMNGDGEINSFDIEPFLECLFP